MDSRGGWIKAHRRLFDPHFSWPIPWRFYFLDLVQMAAYEPTADLKRGQLRASVRFLAERWAIAKASVGRCLDRLESDGAIDRDRLDPRDGRRDAGGTVGGTPSGLITITNYETYQAKPGKAGRQAEPRRDGRRDEVKKLRTENLPSRDSQHPQHHPAAAPEKPTQRTEWPAELQAIWDYLLANDLLGTDLDNPRWSAQQIDWIESKGVEVYFLTELKGYIAHQGSQTRSKQHKNLKRGLRNWLAREILWRERDATREAQRDRRDRR